MKFQHSNEIWGTYPELVAGVLLIGGVHRNVDAEARNAPFNARASERLATSSESEFPEIQAWRRTFSKMGLKPTQYRCASESLLRRFRKEKALPQIHPLIDLCNAISIAFAIPIAVIDLDHIVGDLEVRRAAGDEIYLSFAGDVEHPEVGEVIFADTSGQAHARRWTNRQSARSAIRDTTTNVLIVSEVMHASALEDITALLETLTVELNAVWSVTPRIAILSQEAPQFKM